MWHETIGNRDYRPGYLPGFFQDAAERIPLLGHEALLDLGCGTGNVALGFAPFVSRLTGIDIEQEMLDEAGRLAKAAGRRIELIRAAVDQAPATLGPFDIITMGRAHWHMRSPADFRRIEGWLKDDGVVLICMPTHGGAEWHDAYLGVLKRWASDFGTFRHPTADYFDGRLDLVDQFAAQGGQMVDIDHLVKRTLGFPATTRAKLGERTDTMIAEVRSALAPFFVRGSAYEPLVTHGWMFRRQRRPSAGPT